MASRSRRKTTSAPQIMPWVTAALLTSAGCHPRAASRAKAREEAQARPSSSGEQAQADPAFEREGQLYARHFELTQRLVLKEPSFFARLTPPQRALLARLKANSTIGLRVYLADQRALVVPRPGHPAGALELLVAADRDELIVFTDDRWAHLLALERLPDVLDRSEPSHRHGFEPLILEQRARQADSRQSGLAPLGRTSIVQQLTYKYRPQQERAAWSIRTELEVLTRVASRQQWVDELLYMLMLPQLQTRHGRLICESLRLLVGTPIGWRRDQTNESFASAPAARFSTDLDDRGWVRLPIRRFAARRQDYRHAARLGPPDAPGAQLIPAAQLGALRSGKDSKTLRLDNRSALTALVFLDGAMVGWVAPRKQLTLRGLREGFYRVSAVTPTGIRSWGPYDSFAPGTIALR